jgi:hypothetical protein
MTPRLTIPLLAPADRHIIGDRREGVARYLNDLTGENLDAAFVDGELRAVPVFGVMVGYTHHWNDHWRSTLSRSYVQVDAPESLGRFAIDRTLYSSANLIRLIMGTRCGDLDSGAPSFHPGRARR